ncbi:FecR domain-containing protein [bacterium]|nr:FecR domain-containing protein [bacterium]
MRRAIGILGFITVALAAGILYAQDSESEAIFTYVDGEVVKKQVELEEWEQALLNSKVTKGYKVRTYVESRAELTLNEASVIRLAPRTTIDVVKLFEESREGYNDTLFQVEEGDIWAAVEGLGDDESFVITSDIMGTACRGTTYRVNVAGDGTTMLRVYSGAVELWDPMMAILGPGFWETESVGGEGEGRHEVVGPHEVAGPYEVTEEEWRLQLITGMQQIIVGPDGKIVEKGAFTADDPLELTDWVLWNQERDEAQDR